MLYVWSGGIATKEPKEREKLTGGRECEGSNPEIGTRNAKRRSHSRGGPPDTQAAFV